MLNPVRARLEWSGLRPLIGVESLAATASYLGRASVEPVLLCRNLVVSGITLLALKGVVRVGDALRRADPVADSRN